MSTDEPTLAGDYRLWSARLIKYRQRSNLRAVLEVLITAGPLAGLWGAAVLAASFHYWLAVLLALPAAGFLVGPGAS
jgi:acyl-lipid omega-6 desaturase (Delta-12 desaturase)